MNALNAYGMEIYTTEKGLRIGYNDRTLYPYKKVDTGVFYEWIPWDDATPAQFRRALYRGTACAGPYIIWDVYKTAKTMVKRGRYIGY